MRKSHIALLTIFVLTLLPRPVAAAAAIAVEDTVAGVPVAITVTGLAAGEYDMVVHPSGASAAADIIIPFAADTKGRADVLLRADEVETAGTYAVGIEQNGDVLGAAASFSVLPGPLDLDLSSIEPQAYEFGADSMDPLTVIVRAVDSFGNPLPGRPLSLLTSRSADDVTADTDETDTFGEQSFTLTTEEEGTVTLRALDLLSGRMLTQTTEVEATPWGVGNDDFYEDESGRIFYYTAQVTGGGVGVVDHFDVTASKKVRPGSAIPRVTVTAKDKNGRIVKSYAGTVIASSTDPQADLPGPTKVPEQGQGKLVLDVNIILKTPGKQQLRFEDSQDSSIFGTVDIDVQGTSGGGGAPGAITVTSPKPDQFISSLTLTVEGRGPQFENIVIGGQVVEEVIAGTESDGSFSADVTLRPGSTDYTIVLTRENGGAPKTVTVHLDTEKPEILTGTISPDTAQGGQDVIALVETEKDAVVLLRATKQTTPPFADVELEASSKEPTKYIGNFKAPDAEDVPGGVLPLVIVARDAAGNESTLGVQLKLGGGTLPPVRALEATSDDEGVIHLTWDPVADADGYIIYVGRNETELDEELPTNVNGDQEIPATEADVSGVPPGQTRYFTVTAVQRDPKTNKVVAESPKGTPVKATAKGTVLTARGMENSVSLKWDNFPSEKYADIGFFVVKYGTKPDELPEERVFGRGTYTALIIDLLPNVTYFFTVTPITPAGIRLDDLTAAASATPTGSGIFRPAPPDPIPSGIATKPAAPASMKPGAPLASSGLPSLWWLALLGAAGVVALQWHRRRMLRQTMALLTQMTNERM